MKGPESKKYVNADGSRLAPGDLCMWMSATCTTIWFVIKNDGSDVTLFMGERLFTQSVYWIGGDDAFVINAATRKGAVKK